MYIYIYMHIYISVYLYLTVFVHSFQWKHCQLQLSILPSSPGDASARPASSGPMANDLGAKPFGFALHICIGILYV